MNNRKATRWFSNQQEKKVAKAVKGKQTANSGATAFQKGDIVNKDWLIECKTKTKDSQSISVKKEWIDKNEEETFAMNKHHSAIAFSFGPDEPNYYIISEKEFQRLLEVE